MWGVWLWALLWGRCGDVRDALSSPVLGSSRSVSLSAVFKPVPHLCGCESGGLCKLPLFTGIWVRILQIPLSQQVPGSLLEAVGFLLSVPYGPGQRELLAHPVFVHGPQRAAPQLLRLLVVRLQPQRLQLRVRLFGELVVLQDVVEFTEIAGVEGDDGPGPQHRLVLVEDLAGRRRNGQRPEEAAQALHVPALLQSLADPGDLLGAEIQYGQLKHGGFSRGPFSSSSSSFSPLLRAPPRLLSARQGNPRHPKKRPERSEQPWKNARTERRGGGGRCCEGRWWWWGPRLPHPQALQTWQAKGCSRRF